VSSCLSEKTPDVRIVVGHAKDGIERLIVPSKRVARVFVHDTESVDEPVATWGGICSVAGARRMEVLHTSTSGDVYLLSMRSNS